MSNKNKEQKEIEKLFEARKDTSNFLSGDELAKQAKKSFDSRKEIIKDALDEKK